MDCGPLGSPVCGFPRQEYWSGFPIPFRGDLLSAEIEPMSPALQADSLPSEPQGELESLLKVEALSCFPH